jgi:hypothetical protein
MSELSIPDICLITRDVRRQKITFSHLCDDLIDHVCCDVEYEMGNGLDFEKAYKKVKAKIGIRGLNKIQEETLYAVDTKYRRMKNIMKITGIAGTVLLSFAAMFKIMHWPLAGIMMVLGTFLLVALFMPSSMMVLWKESKSSKHLLLFISAFLASTLFIVGVLFKIQHWQGAGLLISLAILFASLFFFPTYLVFKVKAAENTRKRPIYLLAFITALLYLGYIWFKIMHWPGASFLFILSAVIFIIIVPWYVYLEWKEEQSIRVKFIFLIIALVAILIPSSLINLNLQQNYDDGFFVLVENSQKTIEYSKKTNEAYLSFYRDSLVYYQLENVHDKTLKILNKIDTMKTKMANISGGFMVKSQAGSIINYRQILHPFDLSSSQLMLSPGSNARNVIDSVLNGYVNDMSTHADILNLSLVQNISSIITILPEKYDGQETSTLIAGLHALNMIEVAVLAAESDIFRSVTANPAKKE